MMETLGRIRLARAAERLNRASAAHVPALVLMTDDERLSDPVAAAAALPSGSMVVLRSRQTSHRVKLAAQLSRVAKARGLRLLIAQDPALASRIGAHGVHFSERHAAAAAHWRVLRPRWLITIAVHSLRACLHARRVQANAALLAPIFPTQTHLGGRSLGAARARLTASQSAIPVYALGGIDLKRAQQLGRNFAGIAAIDALTP